jgi:serine beta-lactamase-like protein LACTB
MTWARWISALAAASVAVAVAVAVAAVFAHRRNASDAQSAAVCTDWLVDPRYRAQVDRVRPLVRRMKRAFAAPGLSVAVAVRGKLVWGAGCGLADRGRGLPVTRSTQFRIGSVSKVLTAAAAVRLAESGRLDLDAEVQRYVPSFPRKGRPITPRLLGGHLAGIRHYQGDEALSTRHYRSVLAGLVVFRDDPVVAPPGERFSYSSYGFNLLGAALAAAAHASYAGAVRDNVLVPLAMTHTRLDDGTASIETRFYEVNAERRARLAPRVDLSNRYPSGGWLSTAEDLARLGRGLTSRRFLTPSARAALFAPQRTRSGTSTGFSLGLDVTATPYGPMAGHTGNVVGGTAFLLVHARTRTTVAMTTNIGFVTAARPPALTRDVPDPPQLALPFIRRALREATARARPSP